MSSAQFQIEIIDNSASFAGSGGSSPGNQGNNDFSSPQGSGGNSGSSPKGAGGKEASSDVTSPWEALGQITRIVGGHFNVLYNASELLTRAFKELTSSARKAAQSNKGGKSSSQDSGGGSAGDIEAPPVSGDPVEAPPVIPSLPPTGGIAGDVAAPPVIGGGAAAGAAEGGAAAGGVGAAALGPIGVAVAGVGLLGLAAVKAAQSIEADAEKLSAYNSNLAASTAQAQIRQQYAEMERANDIGDSLSEFQDAFSRVSTDFYRKATSIEGSIAKMATPILNFIDWFMGGGGEPDFDNDDFNNMIEGLPFKGPAARNVAPGRKFEDVFPGKPKGGA